MNKIFEKFKNYYSNLNSEDLNIVNLEKREIALIPFKEDLMIRHLGFKDTNSLKDYLIKNVPLHLYYSSAYYENPQVEDMNLKNWEGADLIFDVDADHIPTDCKILHDKWFCLNCNLQGFGIAPEECPKCGQKRIDTNTWICERCLEVAKIEVLKLIDEYLIPDFGISSKEIEICFSGHRGYHLHIYSEYYKKLSSDGRREIADYIRGIGIDLKSHGLRKVNGIITGPNIREKGWRGRIAKSFYEYLSRASLEELMNIIGKSAEIIIKKRDKILDSIMMNGWFIPKGIGLKRISKIIKEAIKQNFCNIDERVTIDTKRLIRYPNSLHGKTGLKVCRLNYIDLEKFDPLKDAIVFKTGTMKIYVKEMPKIRIGNYEIGPLKNETIEVPESMAIYLICKGAAEMRN
ncbi:MAG: DNA primase small subunit PriS [Candidatus Methanomethylicaceae archaeon]